MLRELKIKDVVYNPDSTYVNWGWRMLMKKTWLLRRVNGKDTIKINN